ncbi:hypothetical protein C4B63_78g28 [Trypanosoma cruzi]|uniref:RNA-binding protein n=1 Tax=Trypanosoma cruzi TaxID=5693 RepID=A0A2V2UY64_TRYCR|nr:hypothetical protein C4B63_78g28 [Trypanosoma cruzi]
MKEAGGFFTVSCTDRGGVGSSQASSSVGKADNSPTSGQFSTPTDSSKGSEKQMHPGSVLPAAGTSGSVFISEKNTGFSVVAGNVPPSNWQTGSNVYWPQSSGKSTLFKSTLNPDAKEFQLPSGQGNDALALTHASMFNPSLTHDVKSSTFMPLFAMPSTTTPWKTGSAVSSEAIFVSGIRADAMKWPQVSVHTRPFASRDAAVPPPSLLTPRTITRQVMDEYAEVCRSKGYHIVTVFNLEPRTTQEELLAIFFPMCAQSAELLPIHYSPRSNRRSGVVFFLSKAIALMAVEKLDGFVPNKQHQPLTVLYSGPDTSENGTRESSILSANSPQSVKSAHQQAQLLPQPAPETVTSGSPQMWRHPAAVQMDQLHKEMWQFVKSTASSSSSGVMKHVVAVHGLTPENAQSVLLWNVINKGAERYELWPMNASGLSSATMPFKGISALVWFSQEAAAKDVVAWFEQQRREGGQALHIDAVYLNKLDFAHENSSVGNAQLRNGVHDANNNGQLTAVTSPSHMAIIENIDAFFFREYDDPKLYLVAVHNLSPNTDKKALFSLFSPHGALDAEVYPGIVEFAGELRRSGVAFFDNEFMARKAAEKLNSFVPFKQPNPLVARYLKKVWNSRMMTPLGCASSSPGMAESAAVAASGTKLNDMVVSVKTMLYAPVLDGERLMEKMLLVITHPDTTREVVEQLASVIVEALTAMSHHAGALSTPLVNALMSLHEKLNIPQNVVKDSNMNEAVKNSELKKYMAYMQLIAHTVINLFMDKTKPHESRKVAAVLSAYLFQFSYLVKTPYELSVLLMKKHEAALNRAREYMMKRHTNIKPVAFLGDGEEEEHRPWLTLMECLEQLTSLWRQNNKSRAKKDPFRKEYEQRVNEFSQGEISLTGGGSSLNTSTRPTPRRVVAKVTPGTGSGGGGGSSSSPGLTHGSSNSSRIDPRTLGENNIMSHEISRESNASPVVVLPVFCANDPNPSGAMRTDENVSMIASKLSQYQLQPQQTLPPQISRRDMPVRSGLSEGLCMSEATKPTLGGSRISGGPVQSVYTHAELMERTVYITKLPSFLRRAQFRRILLHFGEFNKVRLCRDDNQIQAKNEAFISASTSAVSAASSSIQGAEPSVILYFSFVEFAEQSSAKAMIEYFRNIVTNQQPFSFLLDNSVVWPESSYFTPQNIQALLSVRTSPARNPIHDQLPMDAVLVPTANTPRHVLRNRPCVFGIDGGEKTLDATADANSSLSFYAGVFANPSAVCGSSGVGASGRQVSSVVATASESLPLRPSSTSALKTERFHGDAAGEGLDLNAIVSAVAPAVMTNTWVSETVELPGHNEHVFNPIQGSWLTDVTASTLGGDPLAGVTFGEENAHPTTAPAPNACTAEADGKDIWPPCVPSCFHQFFDSESDADDDDDGKNN